MSKEQEIYEDEEHWEEVDEDEEENERQGLEMSISSHSQRAQSPKSAVRRRTRGTVLRRKIQSSGTRKQPKPRQIGEWLEDGLRIVKPIARYVLDVVGGGIYLLRKPLSFLFFLWLLLFILSMVSTQLGRLFQPLCILPGISSSSLCVSSRGMPRPKWADYPKLTEIQTNTFEQLLDASVGGFGGSALSLDVKKAEMATKDLSTLVRYSKLRSRDLIAESLDKFVEDARTTARGLQKLSSKIGGTVDSIMAVNDYALHTIEAAQPNSVSRTVQFFIPFLRIGSHEVVQQTFAEAMTVLSNGIQRLIVEAEVCLNHLERLEEGLGVLHDVVHREDTSITAEKSEILGALWSKLGGNKHKIQGFNRNLELLKGLGVYRKQALAHVVAALQSLRALSDDMEDMRERVTAPDLVGDRIPFDVHLKSISYGLERLKESRIKAKEREDAAVQRVLQLD